MLKTLWQNVLAVLHKIGYVQSQIILGVVYFLLLAPFALAVRLFVDPLRLRQQPSWQALPDKDPEMTPVDAARQQF